MELGEGVTSAEYWMYDGKLGKRWERDPMVNPSVSPYATFDNNPIWKSDHDGLEPKPKLNAQGGKVVNEGKVKKAPNSKPNTKLNNDNTNVIRPVPNMNVPHTQQKQEANRRIDYSGRDPKKEYGPHDPSVNFGPRNPEDVTDVDDKMIAPGGSGYSKELRESIDNIKSGIVSFMDFLVDAYNKSQESTATQPIINNTAPTTTPSPHTSAPDRVIKIWTVQNPDGTYKKDSLKQSEILPGQTADSFYDTSFIPALNPHLK